MRACPHKRVKDCPLYVAAHDARLSGFACTGGLEHSLDECDVSRGASYQALRAGLEALDPELVARLAWVERKTDFEASPRSPRRGSRG